MKNHNFFKKMTQDNYSDILKCRQIIDDEIKSLALFEFELNQYLDIEGFSEIKQNFVELKKTILIFDEKLKDFEL